MSGLLLSNKILGVIGMGNIGQAVARKFVGGLGAHIVAYCNGVRGGEHAVD